LFTDVATNFFRLFAGFGLGSCKNGLDAIGNELNLAWTTEKESECTFQNSKIQRNKVLGILALKPLIRNLLRSIETNEEIPQLNAVVTDKTD
jgi:hypothetical protein